MKKSTLFKLISYWPPFFGAGIKIISISPDVTTIEVAMRLRFWNKNYVGTHFGGSLYSMTDPFFMLILIENLGRNYIVWDKAATIRFKSPGRGRVHARFHIPKEEIAKIRAQADEQDKVEPIFNVQVMDENNKVVAEVEKVLYVRRKDKQRQKN